MLSRHRAATSQKPLDSLGWANLILMSVFKAEDVWHQSLSPARGFAGCARPGAAARGDG